MTAGTRRPNPEQERVIAHGDGPIRIMAGAGTGKTYTITQRVIRLVRDHLARPDQILALTFGNKATAEMRERITTACLDLGVPPDADPVTVLTYHSFGNSVIAEWGGMIGLPPRPPLLSETDSWLLLWDCLPRIDFQFIDLMHLRATYGSPLPDILKLGSRLKDELTTPEALLAYVTGETLPGDALSALSVDDLLDEETRHKLADHARALLVYEAAKKDGGVLDYGDQIALAVRALGLQEVRDSYRDRYRFVLVDEYQDTNFAQSVMVRLLVSDFHRQNVCVVGDVRQAIYRFRGAAPDNLERFPTDFPDTAPYALRSNYRSTGQILAAANAVWNEPEADLVSHDGREGAPVIACACEDPESEWQWIADRVRSHHEAGVAYREMAVLVRRNEMKRQAWKGLMTRGIPALMTGGNDLFHTPEVRELLSYLRALARPGDTVSLAHIASSDSFGLDEATLYDLIGPMPRGRSLFDLLVERGSDSAAPNDLRLFLATFQQLLSDAATLSPCRVVERIIGLRRGAYSDLQRANVYRFHSMAEEFAADRTRRATIGSFVSFLNLLQSAPSDREEATDVTEEDAVQVLTVHAAKGLERRVLFLATASQEDFTIPNNRELLPLPLQHPAAGMPVTDAYPTSKKYLAALRAWEGEQHRLEERRVLYVALTRAQDQLYISWHRLPLSRGKERSPLKALESTLRLARRETFDRTEWEEDAPQTLPDVGEIARRFARLQAKVWANWDLDGFEGGLAGRVTDAWNLYLGEAELPAHREDILAGGMEHWEVERRRVEALLGRCLNPAVRPADADRRPVVDVPTTLSYSMLSTYRDCSRKAYLRFLVGFPGEPRPGATGAGTAFHAAVETSAAAQISGGELSLEDLLQVYTEAAAESHGVTLYTPDEGEKAMIRAYWASPDRLALPLAVEQEFYWRVGPGYLHGFIDRIQHCPDGSIELVDFKTGRTAMSAEEAQGSLQLLIYALAAREVLDLSLDRLSLVYPRLGKRVSVAFTDDELRTARTDIVNLMERARTASYDEVDTTHCRTCEYRLICPAAAGAVSREA